MIRTLLYVVAGIIATAAITWEVASLVIHPSPVQVSEAPGAPEIRFISWGGLGDACSATIDASRASEKSRDKYELALICGIGDPAFDRMKDERITVSPLFTLQSGQFPISVLHSKAMSEASTKLINEAVRNAPFPRGTGVVVTYMTWVKLALLPKAVNVSSIHRLADVPKYGGELLPGEYASATVAIRPKL